MMMIRAKTLDKTKFKQSRFGIFEKQAVILCPNAKLTQWP